jgi:hypothetical protein
MTEPTKSSEPTAPEPMPSSATPAAPVGWAAPATAPAAVAGGRPTGASIVAVISAVYGVFSALGALAGLFVGGVAAGAGDGVLGGVIAGAGFVFAAIFLLIAIGFFGTAFGLWNRRPWAWTLGFALWIIALVLAILGLGNGVNASNLVSLIAAGASVFLLWQADVKRFYGRS